LFFGIASGMITAGATSLMLDLTAAETAGPFIGAWGLAQSIARGLSTVLGGFVLNIGKILFTSPVFAYSTVFVLQALGLILAIVILRRVNVQEFQERANNAIAIVMEGELE
jgi:BCD family chlorophyll transporter-like MFS transporter